MARLLGIAAHVAAAVAVLAQASAGAASLTREKLDEVAKKLQANAQVWAKGEEIPSADKADLKGVTFDKESVQHLSAFLRTAKRDTAGLYVINRLLERLQRADTETIQAAMPAVESLHSRTKNAYRTVPRYSKAYLNTLKLPAYRKGITTPEIMGRMSTLEKRRDDKVAREQPVVQHNGQVYELEKNAYELMLLAKDSKKDDVVVRNMLNAELRSSAMFLTLADMLGKAAKKMDAARAKSIHNRLKAHGARLRMHNRKSYSHRGRLLIRRDATSDYEKRSEYPGIKLLDAMNKIAAAAKLPRVKVPSQQQITEYNKKNTATRR